MAINRPSIVLIAPPTFRAKFSYTQGALIVRKGIVREQTGEAPAGLAPALHGLPLYMIMSFILARCQILEDAPELL